MVKRLQMARTVKAKPKKKSGAVSVRKQIEDINARGDWSEGDLGHWTLAAGV